MGRAALTLYGNADREKAIDWIRRARPMSRIEFKGPARSVDQNGLMWQRLTDIALQHTWHGDKLSPDDWKDLFTAALRTARVVPGIDPGTCVPLGLRTSDMSKEEFTALLDLISAFAAEHGIVLRDEQEIV
jgi:hypothetical protein